MRILLRPTWISSLVLAAMFTADSQVSGKPASFMMQARIDGRTIEGQPLAWNKVQMLLLGRDGRLYDFDPRKATHSRKSGPRFFGYSMSEMKQELYGEFGKTSEITTTRHYIVVHPTGQKSDWANRFEELYRDFSRYFRVRGFDPEEPPYPLVAIVFRSEAQYFAHAANEGNELRPGTLGHYSPESNRVFLFDARGDGGDWRQNADTIIHEATHQTAFNTGIHTRFAGAPRWVVEGLATMFEVRGVYEHRLSDNRHDRLNEGRLREFAAFATGKRPSGFMSELIATDSAFRRDPNSAYAEAWALTFFLAETRPRQYAEYLQRTADREMFTEYTPEERLADFQDIFHKDLKWFESQFLKYMEDFK